MSELDKRQELSEARAAMLAAMGVQVWRARGSGPGTTEDMLSERVVAPVTATAKEYNKAQIPQVDHLPTAKQPPVAKIERIEFSWVKGRSGMVLCQLNPDAAALQLIRDIVVFGDWVRQQGEASKLSKGDFQWPQLLDTEGSPARAFAVFVDKHWPEQGAWIAVTSEVQANVSPWLENIPVKVIDLPAIQQSIRDAALKKTIWQSLKASV